MDKMLIYILGIDHGCTVNELLNAAIELAIIGHADFEFGEPEDDRIGSIEYERHRLGQA